MVLRVLLIFCFSTALLAQDLSQTVKGKVVDKESKSAIPGAVVRLASDSSFKSASQTDDNGYFKIVEVPIGRQNFVVSFIGYKSITIPDVTVTSAKEVVLNIELEEAFQETDEVVITHTDKAGALNEMSSVSTRLFRVEETERYPGSRQDPARMAANFAGVQGSNDTRNDIVVRGNSPSSLLWRLEEVDIPNPNHFAVGGSMGGPVSIINNKYLGSSDFLTGAFPAMYGNANGGVFDIRMRNGNDDKHEHTFQFGILGTELTSEGPIKRSSKATYIATYRYSTFQILQGLNVSIGTNAIPKYQDAGFKVTLPTKKAGTFSIWGIGGLSSIDIIVSKFKDPKEVNESYGDKSRDQYFRTNMGVAGASHTYQLNKKTIFKTTLAQSGQSINSNHYFVFRGKDGVPVESFPKILSYKMEEGKSTLAFYANTKLNARHSYRAGFFVSNYTVNLYDKIRIVGTNDTSVAMIENLPFKVRLNQKASYQLVQPYVQYKFRLRDNLTLNAGVYGQVLTLNNKATVEPRAGLRWDIKPKHTLSFGYGLHSQMQNTYIYFSIPDTLVQNGQKVYNVNREEANKDLGFTRSQHFVLGYDFAVSKEFRIKAETYYQNLWNIPVYSTPSGVSLVNQGATFTRFFPIYQMENKGTGQNYGIELTLEKFFSKHYFLLWSTSLFDSKYQGSNGKTYNTDFNGNYVTNLLAGLEYGIGKAKKNSISFGSKFTYAGGRRYSPVNIVESNKIYDIVPQEEKINSLQFPNYNRFDIRIAYKVNNKKVTHEVALDLVNVFNTKNVLALSFSP
ncbi:MAG: TonB-dependent receptor, partial [Opitutaceae bacterium]|nr:TonB-dependent receptor [Cytophagales bacterium]